MPIQNGSSISAYHLQIARGRGEPFTVVYDGPNEQARITGLEVCIFVIKLIDAINGYF